MSTMLYYRKAPTEKIDLNDELKNILSVRLFRTDIELAGQSIIVGNDLLSYLEGIIDSTEPDERLYFSASSLHQAILESGKVELLIEKRVL